jgi:DNA repair ATPase RecN
MASKCFADKNITPEQWVQICIDRELTCVAVTDHNTNEGISAIQKAAQQKGLHVFPGVEITCDTAGIHLLILFDINKTEKDVADFLAKCGINHKEYGDQLAHSEHDIFKVVKIAEESQALVIPAHIDEFNGLGSVKHSRLKDFYNLKNITAVQVVHKKFVDDNMKDINIYLKDYYNKPISDEISKDWKKTVALAKEQNLSILTFSDNPHEKGSSKHGLWGIGKRFTWIQMDQKPSIEGLRQAFLSPNNRIQNDFEGIDFPHIPRKTIIKSIKLSNTTLNNSEFNIDFHSQLNVIIGGPGSGKSSILRCIRGVLKNTKDIKNLPNIQKEQNDFYKKVDSKTKNGIFQEDSNISALLLHEGLEYEITAHDIEDVDKQKIKVYCIDGDQKKEQENPEEFLNFFQVEHYSQKQIYEISKETSALRDKINSSFQAYEEYRNKLEEIKSSFLHKAAALRNLLSLSYKKKTIEAEIQKIENQIDIFEKSGIKDIIRKVRKFRTGEQQIDNQLSKLSQKIEAIESVKEKLKGNLTFNDFDEVALDELNIIFSPFEKKINSVIEFLNENLKDLNNLRDNLNQSIKNSTWNKQKIENTNRLQELEMQNLGSTDEINKLLSEKSNKEKELKQIAQYLEQVESLKKEKIDIQYEYLKKVKELSNQRKSFVQSLNSHNIRIKVKQFRDKISFENNIGDIINIGNKYEGDLKKLVDVCFGEEKDNLEKRLEIFRKHIKNLRYNNAIPEIVDKYSKRFIKFFEKIDDAIIDTLQIIVPDDEIVLEYKPKGEKEFKPLYNASAGQKATAILTFILSLGSCPLILDQPEDDLNGKLVYDLVVDKIRLAKKERQIIVVTHNPNIPVNADADFIICMDSTLSKIQILAEGTLENERIKKEICDTMEGSVDAFKARADRYKHN